MFMSSLVPRPSVCAEGRGPGIDCFRMRENLHKAPRIWGQIGRTFEARSRETNVMEAVSVFGKDERYTDQT